MKQIKSVSCFAHSLHAVTSSFAAHSLHNYTTGSPRLIFATLIWLTPTLYI